MPGALARFGLLSRGIVYVLIGGIAARVAILQRGSATGRRARSPGSSPGREAPSLDRGGRPFRVRALSRPAGRAHAPAPLTDLLLHERAGRARPRDRGRARSPRVRSGADEAGLRDLAARLLSHDWGRLGLGLGGVIAIVIGGVEAVRAVLGRLPADFTAAIMARVQRKWTSVLARLGMFAHGIVAAIIGYSICRAALEERAGPRRDGNRAPYAQALRIGTSPPRARRRRADRVRALAPRPRRPRPPALALTRIASACPGRRFQSTPIDTTSTGAGDATSRPILWTPFSVNQRAPSGPVVIR